MMGKSRTFRKNTKSYRKKSNVSKSRSFRKRRNAMRGGTYEELIRFLNERELTTLSSYFSKCKPKIKSKAVTLYYMFNSQPDRLTESLTDLMDLMTGHKRKRPVPAEVVPLTREQLLERRLALIESLQKLRAELEERGEDDFISMRMRHIQGEIDEIDFQLKTPEEQAAILERQKKQKEDRDAIRVFEQQQLGQQKQKELDEQHQQQSKQKRLDREKMQAVRSEEKRRVEEWEQEHLEQLLHDKSFVKSQLHGLRTHHEALTAEGQPRGATLGYPIWYELMIELLRKYERA
jgi:hypothetical protein